MDLLWIRTPPPPPAPLHSEHTQGGLPGGTDRVIVGDVLSFSLFPFFFSSVCLAHSDLLSFLSLALTLSVSLAHSFFFSAFHRGGNIRGIDQTSVPQ